MKFFWSMVILALIAIERCRSEFDPYVDNSGTVTAIAGKDYFIISADTRLSDQYMIRSRNLTKLFEISPGIIFSGSGCWSDIVEVSKVMQYRQRLFQYECQRDMTIEETSYVLSQLLYSKRFQPYYSLSIIGGLDKNGHGALYKYDALGSYERVRAICSGKGEKMIQPILDQLSYMEADTSLWEDFLTSTHHHPENDKNHENDRNHENGGNVLYSGIESQSSDTIDISTDVHDDGNNHIDIHIHRNRNKEDTTSADRISDDSSNNDKLHISNNNNTILSSLSSISMSTSIPINKYPYISISIDEACEVIYNSYKGACEREISIGDGVNIWIICKKHKDYTYQSQSKDGNTQENTDNVSSDISVDHTKSSVESQQVVDKEMDIENNDTIETKARKKLIQSKLSTIFHRHAYHLEKRYLPLPKH